VKEEAAAAQAAKIKAQMDLQAKLEREYNERLSNANPYDGTVHLGNGQKVFVDSGDLVDGVNVYSQHKQHERHAKASMEKKHKTHHKMAVKEQMGHKKHASHKVHHNGHNNGESSHHVDKAVKQAAA
jgi:hypothetical protein